MCPKRDTPKNASHLLSHKIPHIPIKRYNQSEIHFYQVFLLIRKICSSCDRNSLPLSERKIKCFPTPQSKSAILPAPLKRGALLPPYFCLKAKIHLSQRCRLFAPGRGSEWRPQVAATTRKRTPSGVLNSAFCILNSAFRLSFF